MLYLADFSLYFIKTSCYITRNLRLGKFLPQLQSYVSRSPKVYLGRQPEFSITLIGR